MTSGAQLPDAYHVVGRAQVRELLALDLGFITRGKLAGGDVEGARLAQVGGDAVRPQVSQRHPGAPLRRSDDDGRWAGCLRHAVDHYVGSRLARVGRPPCSVMYASTVAVHAPCARRIDSTHSRSAPCPPRARVTTWAIAITSGAAAATAMASPVRGGAGASSGSSPM